MAAEMTLKNSDGDEYKFSDYGEVPLIERKVQIEKATRSGNGTRTIIVTLSGFFDGNDHKEIVTSYMRLVSFLKKKELKFTWDTSKNPDNSGKVVNEQIVQVLDYSEPTDWKQYYGDYTVSFSYEEPYDSQKVFSETVCYYVSDAGTYSFIPCPDIDMSLTPSRKSNTQPRTTYGKDKLIGLERRITLSGNLQCNNENDYRVKRKELEDALKTDGVLNYGNVQYLNAKVMSLKLPSSFPGLSCPYVIEFSAYSDSEILEMSFKKVASRIHRYPRRRDRVLCCDKRVRTFCESGQDITYTAKLRSTSIPQARKLLDAELKSNVVQLIHPGGTEMEGGTHEEDWDSSTVTVTIPMYYTTAQIPNIGT